MRVITARALAAPSLAALLALGWATPAVADIHLCTDFSNPADAQRALDQNPGLAGTLDSNGDGKACNEGGAGAAGGGGEGSGGTTGGGTTGGGTTGGGTTGGGTTGGGANNVPDGDTGWGEGGSTDVTLATLGGLAFLVTTGTVVVRRRAGAAA